MPYVLGGLVVASLMAYRLLSFTVFNASGVHIFRFIGCWWWQTDIPWVAFRETARVDLQEAPYDIHGFTPPDTHNLALHLTTMEEWAKQSESAFAPRPVPHKSGMPWPRLLASRS